jgi:plastocyanin
MMKHSPLLLLALAGFAFAKPSVVYAPDSAPFSAQAARTTGTATGRVVFEGTLPRQTALVVSELASKGCTSDGSKVSAENMQLLIHEDRGIANVLVTIDLAGQELRVPKEPVVLDQVQCRFVQHVAVVPVGTTVSFRNSDDLPHNVKLSCRKNTPLNRTLVGNSSYEVVMKHAESIQIACDFHSWMKSYLCVVDTNYVALTDEHGAFSIPGLPPGEYTAKLWHEKLGRSKVAIVVDKDGKSTAVEAKLAAKKSRRSK